MDVSGLPPGRLTVTVDEGRISDFGPSETVYGLAGIRRSGLDESGRVLTMEFDGYDGLFFVATQPPAAPVTVELVSSGESTPVTLGGELQLPLELLGRPLDPREHAAALSAPATPFRREIPDTQLRLWWDPFLAAEGSGDRESFSDFERILRDWGYIR